MKAIVNSRYGSPDVLELRDIARARPDRRPGAGPGPARPWYNAHDWHMLRGEPFIARLDAGLRRPKETVQGLDVAGIVEAVGTDVTHTSEWATRCSARASARSRST